MSLITAIDIVRKTRIGVNVVNEQIGIGDGSTTKFLFDSGRVVPNSEVVYVDGTAKTRGTDYTIDNDIGRVTFTTAPTADKEVTAKYTHVDPESIDILSADYDFYINEAEAWVKRYTGRVYESEASTSEWFDGNARLLTDNTVTIGNGLYPGHYAYYEDNFLFFLSKKPVTAIEHVYLMQPGSEFSKVWGYDLTYTDNTSDANSVGGTAFALFPDGGTDNYLYLGCADRFSNIYLILGAKSDGTGVMSDGWEYYNGSSWTALTVTDETAELTVDGLISWSLPSDWGKTSVNNYDAYYVRCQPSTAFSVVNPTALQIRLEQDYVISDEVSVNEVSVYKDNGIVVFKNKYPDYSFRTVRFDYKYGLKSGTAPQEYLDLIKVVASIRLITGLLVGSFDNVVNFSLPEMSAQLGEAYTQFREALTWLVRERDDLIRVNGMKFNAGA
jgi:hypothetical protein